MEFNELEVSSRGILARFIDRWLPRFFSTSVSGSDSAIEAEIARPRGRIPVPLPFLKSIPYICMAGLVTSFLLPEQILYLPWRTGEKQIIPFVIRTISTAGLIGYITNWLAVKMLFHPAKPRPLLGQGLIGANRERIVQSLADSIREEIINEDMLRRKIQETGIIGRKLTEASNSFHEMIRNQDFRSDLTELIRHYAESLLSNPGIREMIVRRLLSIDPGRISGVEGKVLSLYRFLRGEKGMEAKIRELLDQIPVRISPDDDSLHSILDSLPQRFDEYLPLIERHVANAAVMMIEHADPHSVIRENLNAFDERRLETLLLKSTSDQLNYIQYLGGFLGIGGGFFILFPVEASVFLGVTGSGVFFVDWLLGKLRQ